MLPVEAAFPADGLCAILAVACAQKGSGYKELMVYLDSLKSVWVDELGEYKVILGDVIVSWKLTVEQYIPNSKIEIEINGEPITQFYRMSMKLLIDPQAVN